MECSSDLNLAFVLAALFRCFCSLCTVWSVELALFKTAKRGVFVLVVVLMETFGFCSPLDELFCCVLV